MTSLPWAHGLRLCAAPATRCWPSLVHPATVALDRGHGLPGGDSQHVTAEPGFLRLQRLVATKGRLGPMSVCSPLTWALALPRVGPHDLWEGRREVSTVDAKYGKDSECTKDDYIPSCSRTSASGTEVSRQTARLTALNTKD